MSILSTLTRLASDYRARRRRLGTYLEIAALPHELQKDIGWPDAVTDDEGPRHRLARRNRL